MHKGLYLFVLALVVGALGAAYPSDATQPPDWRDDWAVADGFSLQRDSLGYDFPTAIAFVSHPGPAPDDPLYFVAELRGAIKVVTNDRTVHTFADDFFALRPSAELPSGGGEVGLAGLCLAPRQGYVFATFAYQDAGGILRNNIVRFESAPGTFGLAPIAQTDFRQIFAHDESSTSHQIGSCQIGEDGLLYVGVGDGHQIDRSQEIDSTLGKVLRMTLNGDPVDDNPFRRDEDRQTPQNYVWALGFRNPFGLQTVGERVFVADNGLNIDRLLATEAGGNYLWDGSDWSTGSNTAFTLAPSMGVVQMAFMGEDTAGFPPSYRDSFFVALSGNLPWTTNAAVQRPPGVIAVPYDFANDRLAAVPDYILRYLGASVQMAAGVAMGSDGLYVVPLYPDVEGESAVYRLAYTPDQPHPHLLANEQDAVFLMAKHGCLACHSLDGNGGSAAPPLDRDGLVARVQSRLRADSYWQALASLDADSSQPAEWATVRQRLRDAGEQEQVAVWVQSRIQEPRFDNPTIQMPDFGLSAEEAETIARYLVAGDAESAAPRQPSLASLAQRLIPTSITPLSLAIVFAGGFLVGGVFVLAAGWLRRRIR